MASNSARLMKQFGPLMERMGPVMENMGDLLSTDSEDTGEDQHTGN